MLKNQRLRIRKFGVDTVAKTNLFRLDLMNCNFDTIEHSIWSLFLREHRRSTRAGGGGGHRRSSLSTACTSSICH